MPISTDTKVRVAHADVAMHMAFPRSVAHWQGKDGTQDTWKVWAGNCDSILLGRNEGAVIDGDCINGVSAPDGGLIHIYGDLGSKIEVHGHCEVVITGDVGRDAEIEASGIGKFYIGGKCFGDLRSSGSVTIWIESDFHGSIKTGRPSTDLYVGGDYGGGIVPSESADLLSLTVAGFAPHASLLKIVDCGYVQFNASIARSDVSPGLYPLDGYHRKTRRGNSFNRWCVRSQRQGTTNGKA